MKSGQTLATTLLSLALALFIPTPSLFAADDRDFFEPKVRPVLVQHCYRCHSAEAKKLRGGLRLDSREAMLTGGDSGPALTPKQPDKSRIIGQLLTKMSNCKCRRAASCPIPPLPI
jgi:hypothetical protein